MSYNNCNRLVMVVTRTWHLRNTLIAAMILVQITLSSFDGRYCFSYSSVQFFYNRYFPVSIREFTCIVVPIVSRSYIKFMK